MGGGHERFRSKLSLDVAEGEVILKQEKTAVRRSFWGYSDSTAGEPAIGLHFLVRGWDSLGHTERLDIQFGNPCWSGLLLLRHRGLEAYQFTRHNIAE